MILAGRTGVAPTPARRIGIGLALVALLAGVYFFVFDGHASSADEWYLFDATESLARRGDMRLNYFHPDVKTPLTLAEADPPTAGSEPLQPLLAVPLFWLAAALPGVGLVHAVWLFSIVTTALTGGVLYAYGLALGYRARTAAIVALLYGLTTIALPYSRTYFREPLFTLLALLSALLTLRLRRALAAGQRPVGVMIALAIAFGGALFSKEAALLLVPAIAVEAFPGRVARVAHPRRTLIALAVVGVVVIALLVLAVNAETLLGLDTGRWALANRLTQVRSNLARAAEGVKGYLFSPARSLWVFSPVLLAGLFALPRLARAGRWRLIVTPLTMLVTFVIGYAMVRGAEWYGGRGWGPRYLVAVTPFLALWLLPVVERLLAAGASRRARIGFGALVALSAGVQVLNVAVPLETYYAALAAQDPPVIPWTEGAWSVRWSPLWVALEHVGERTPDVLWLHAAGPAWALPLLAAGLIVAALGWLIAWVRRRDGSRRDALLTAGTLALAGAVAFGGGLYAARQDPRYYGDFAPLRDLLTQLEQDAQPGDAIVLSDFTYREFFMNAYKLRAPEVYTLAYSPGTRPSPEATPLVVSDNPDALIDPSNTLILWNLAQHHDRLWLITNASPFVPWSVRPVEQYLARHAFPVGEFQGSDVARAVLFDTTAAPPPSAPRWPDWRLDATFGEALRLVGFDLPEGTTVAAGDVLPISLLWEAIAPVAVDYNVGLLLIAPDGSVAAQRDSFPVNAFAPTSTWAAGQLLRDNHGVAIPAGLPAGEYALWAVLYDWRTPADRLPVRAGDGPPADHAVLATITVE